MFGILLYMERSLLPIIHCDIRCFRTRAVYLGVASKLVLKKHNNHNKKFRKNVKCTVQALTSDPKNKANLPNMPGRVSLSPRHYLFRKSSSVSQSFSGRKRSLPRRPVFQNIFCTEEFLFHADFFCTQDIFSPEDFLCQEDLFLSSRYL